MADLVGQQLGKYHLVRLLGRGGFAEVYLGQHNFLQTQVAIRVLPPQSFKGNTDELRSEFHVPDWFAAAFIEKLYEELLQKRPIGEALLAARRHFWESENNPLGLGYALYSSPSIRIAE